MPDDYSGPYTDAQLSDGTTLRFKGELDAPTVRTKVATYRAGAPDAAAQAHAQTAATVKSPMGENYGMDVDSYAAAHPEQRQRIAQGSSLALPEAMMGGAAAGTLGTAAAVGTGDLAQNAQEGEPEDIKGAAKDTAITYAGGKALEAAPTLLSRMWKYREPIGTAAKEAGSMVFPRTARLLNKISKMAPEAEEVPEYKPYTARKGVMQGDTNRSTPRGGPATGGTPNNRLAQQIRATRLAGKVAADADNIPHWQEGKPPTTRGSQAWSLKRGATPELQRAAEAGDPDAQTVMQRLHKKGIMIPRPTIGTK